MNIKVLSYYISSNNRPEQDSAYSLFKECYGKDAHAINITNIQEIAKTINGLFMQRPEK